MRYAMFKYVLVICICCSLSALGQEKKPERQHHAYKIDVVLTESEGGKTVNSRSYTMLVNDNDVGRIRQGDRIPINVGSVTPATNQSSPPTSQIQYMDVGFNLDCVMTSVEDGLYMRTVLDMSTLAPEQAQGTSGNPIVRQQRYQTGSLVQPGKRIVIATVDQLDSKRKLQIETLLTQVQ
jgi:hypothetical protein